MADTLAVDLVAALAWQRSEALSLSTVEDQATLEFRPSLTDGTANGQADRLWHDERAVAGGANDDLDLTSLVTDLFGDSVVVSFSTIKAVLLVVTTTTSGAMLHVGGAGSGDNGFGAPFNDDPDAVLQVAAEGCLMLVHQQSGWIVDNGVADVLRVHNPGASPVTYKIVFVGT